MLGTRNVNEYESEDGDKANADEAEDASQVDTGSTQNVWELGHGRFNLRTSNDDGYEGADGDNADQEEEALQANDRSKLNVED